MGDIDLSEYEICINDRYKSIYLYHQAHCGRRYFPIEEHPATMADLMEAIYDHDRKHHQ